jgi:hypothetical protein
MTLHSKLKLVCNVIRYGVLVFIITFVLAMAGQYVLNDGGTVTLWGSSLTYNLVGSKFYQDMAATPGVSLWGVAFFPLLTFCVTTFASFWFYRLFGYYAKGQFFGDDVMRCYFMIIFTRIIDFFYTAFYDQLIWMFHPGRSEIKANILFDVQAFFTLVVLLVILYILKMANQLDKENQEFI